MATTHPSTVDAVVIGAGLAGLRAAADLVASGAQVVVLEARDRVGGRVFSHRFTDGQTCERGAEFIDGSHVEVLALAAELGLPVSERGGDLDPHGTLVDAGGRAVPMQLHASLAGDLAGWTAAQAALMPTDEYEAGSLADLIGPLGLSAVSRLVVGRDIRTEFMLPPEAVGRRFAAEVQSRRVAGERERHRVVGGNDQLAIGLAARLGSRVRLSTPVRSIVADSGLVTLADGEVLAAAAVIAAVPLPVLTRLWPAVPGELGSVGYGVGGKISAQFGRRIWRDYSRNGTVLSDRSWGHLWETTDDQPGDAGVLTSLLSSYDGADFVALPEAPDRLVHEIDRIFPGAKGLAGERVVTDWTNDPCSLGTYSCFGPGQWLAAQTALHVVHGRLWLAGEHADGFAGFMEGALRSGARVAAKIAAG
ncbi:MAG: FAD-dependent oxidoreductase [Ilumatobacteraceae bacterium]|nr:FAD-dependent oxidoreductase [Ilumatobacteraceae bacterium]